MEKLFEKIKMKYDVLPDLFYIIEDEYKEGLVKDYNDIDVIIQDYITEEDEFLLGPINLCKKIEDRDFVKRLIKERI